MECRSVKSHLRDEFIALPWAAEAATISWQMPVRGTLDLAATVYEDGKGSEAGTVHLTPVSKTGDIMIA